MSERIYFWDNAKGILIFLVVFGHFILPFRHLPETRIIFDLIYLFHMPAFVFVAGYLSQYMSDNKKTIFRLFIAYILFNLPMMVFVVLFTGQKPSLLTPYYSYWFLLALIAWRLITPYISRTRLVLLSSITVSILIGFWNEINNVMALSRIIGFFPFFLTGYMLSEYQLKGFFSQIRPFHICIGGCLLVITLLLGANLSKTGIIAMSDLLFFPYEQPMRFLLRILMILISFLVLINMLIILPKRSIPFLTKWGRNSLSIYLLHRYIPFFFSTFLSLNYHNSSFILICSIIGSLVTLIILGLNNVNKMLNQILDILYKTLSNLKEGNKGIRMAFTSFLLCHLIFVISITSQASDSDKNVIHPVLTADQKAQIENAVSISFVGDLILLRDQVREAYCTEAKVYDFDPVFSFAQKYFLDADFSLGVLEGPFAGIEKGFSTSTYTDGIPLHLNFPDSFADSIKEAGIDLVTLANNHLLDRGVKGAMRTMDVLSEKNLRYVGAYKNQFEKERPKIIEIGGIRLAILSYTYPCNYYSEEYFFEENPSITSIIVDKESRFFNKALSQVRKDFHRAKEQDPDLIIVLPHMGTQFINETDEFQKTWNEIFIRNGADIIFGDHSHAVQPIEFQSVSDNGVVRQAVIVNCPGNFVNSYVEHNGDATSIIKIFINSESRSILCAGVIPMWTHAAYKGQHRALPIYSILFNPLLKGKISLHDMHRIREVQALVTKVMLGEEVSLDQAQDIYYMFPEGYHRQSVTGISLSNTTYQEDIYKSLQESRDVLFVGDSITEGTKNGGYGWFEPITEGMPFLSAYKAAWGGATSKTLLNYSEKISSHEADLYVIAIGANDIRYRDEKICAMTPKRYIENIDTLVKKISKKRSDANFIFVSPWPSLPNDPLTKLPLDQKDKLFFDYTKSLQNYCYEKGFLFVDPSSKIMSAIEKKISGYYLLDHIHPNASKGLRLYSESFLSPK